MRVIPITYRQACTFICKHHRHHKPPQGHKFSIGLVSDGRLVGVVVVGRPVNRVLDDGLTAEVTRLCTDGTKNACSKLYSAAWRSAKGMGYTRIVTYILNSEPGTSLLAAGWKCIAETRGGTWNRPTRERVDDHPLQGKLRFEINQSNS